MNTPLALSIRRRAQRGFTLIELAIVVAITGILVGVGAPAFSGLVRSTRLTTATNDLFAGVLMARSEAIKRRSRVALCKSGDGATCAASGGWEQGSIVFHDANNDGKRQPGEEIVWRAQAMAGDVRVLGNINVSKYVSYSPTGEAKLASGGFQAGTITVCNASSASQVGREIVISSAGRPRVQKSQVATCA